ncbi:hypothetical protein B6N60_03651 [Richelia sinica FACHB-800]|uniref:Uncharacterized protein n=1 Tax=Richelia sinica FACHB-800 TaxID=1357546 RepID=A0A975TBM9_9NOST|nr:hypothetical protein B6N60_03651 [Richelia sinica FACHB-800]
MNIVCKKSIDLIQEIPLVINKVLCSLASIKLKALHLAMFYLANNIHTESIQDKINYFQSIFHEQKSRLSNNKSV